MDNQRGQALLIVILVMVVALTVGLSITSRTITNIRNTEEEENSQRAFSAAEAGVEQVLKELCSSPPCVGEKTYTQNKTTAKIVTNVLTGSQFVMNGYGPVRKDEGGDIWMVEHDGPNGGPNYDRPWSSGIVTIYWADPSESSDCSSAALAAIVLSGTLISPQASRYAFDPCLDRRVVNSFTAVTAGLYTVTVSGASYTFKYTTGPISVTNGLNARVVPLYTNTKIGFSSGVGLPSQGRVIDSTGESGTTTRKLRFSEQYPSLPSELFQYLQFSTY